MKRSRESGRRTVMCTTAKLCRGTQPGATVQTAYAIVARWLFRWQMTSLQLATTSCSLQPSSWRLDHAVYGLPAGRFEAAAWVVVCSAHLQQYCAAKPRATAAAVSQLLVITVSLPCVAVPRSLCCGARESKHEAAHS